MIFGLFRVSGHSMFPQISPGDIVFTSSLFSLKPNDIAVFKLGNKKMVKRISKISKDRIYIHGDNKNDSLDVGWITKKDIIGKVLFVIK